MDAIELAPHPACERIAQVVKSLHASVRANDHLEIAIAFQIADGNTPWIATADRPTRQCVTRPIHNRDLGDEVVWYVRYHNVQRIVIVKIGHSH